MSSRTDRLAPALAAWAILAPAAIAGCEKVDLDQLVFTCRSDVDCARGKRCDLARNICVPPDQLTEPDAGPRDAEPAPDAPPGPPDAGMDDVGPRDGGQVRCIASENTLTGGVDSWWCYGGTPAELEDFARVHHASIVDLEVEPVSDEHRFDAVLIPEDGLHRSWSFNFTSDRDDGGVARYPDLENGLRTTAYTPYEASNGDYHLAAIYVGYGHRCGGWHWFYQPPTYAAVQGAINRLRGEGLLDVDRYGSTHETAVCLSWSGARSATIAFDQSAADIEARLTDRALQLRSFQSTHSGLYTVLYEAHDPGTLHQFWVHDLDEAGLIAAARDRHAFVRDIAVRRVAGSRSFSARLVGSSTISAAREADGRRLAAMLAGGTRSATVGVYLSQDRGEALVHINDRRPFPAGSLLDALLVAHGRLVTESSTPTASLDELIPLPVAACGTSSTSTHSETLGAALTELLRSGDRRRAQSVFDRFGVEAIARRARGYSMLDSEVVVAPGCDTAGRANTTTLLDQAAFLEYALNCSLSRGSVAFFRATMPGRPMMPDPEDLRAAIAEVAAEEAGRAGMTMGQLSQLSAALEVEYVAGAPDSGAGRVSRSIVGRAVIPYCAPARRSRVYFFGLFVDGDADAAAAGVTIDAVKRELLRAPIRAAIAEGVSCFGS